MDLPLAQAHVEGAESLLLRRYNHRKGVLVACACCRRVWQHLTDVSIQQTVQSAEAYADGAGDAHTIGYAEGVAHAARRQSGGLLGQIRNRLQPGRRAAVEWLGALAQAVRGTTRREFLAAMQAGANTSADPAQERAWQCQVIRDIFTDPVAIDPAWKVWNDGTVAKLAEAIYDERELPSGHLDAGRLAILADALEDAGCSNADILSHCRAPGPHVRGCWVVDLLVGKE